MLNNKLKRNKKEKPKKKNLKRKGVMINAKKVKKKTKDHDIVFLRQVPLHPRQRLVRATKKTTRR